MPKLLKIVAFILFVSHPTGADVKIYRDAWGVPHIYAQTPEATMYGFGYAQAEDRLEALLTNFRLATGTMSEAFGANHLEHDFQQRLWKHKKLAQEKYVELAPDVRIFIEKFVLGIQHCMQQNPQRVPPWATAPTPQDVVALGHYLAYQPLLQQANSEYTGKALAFNSGNQWVVSAKRAAENAVILCTDPFAPFDDTFRAYEAHLHSPTLKAFGFAIPGLPVFTTGHNQTIGWSSFPGGADGADVYEIKLDSPIANRYKYDHQWRPIHTDTTHIAVRVGNTVTHKTRLYQHTHHGPIIHRNDNHAYAYKIALANDIGQIEQYYRMMTAKDQKAFYEALKQNHLSPRRIIYGDVFGNIAYFGTGRIPMRSAFFTWNRPMSGNTSETEWQGFHHQDEMPQMLNPNSEWIQDSDASPDRLTPGTMLTSPLQPAYMSRYYPQTESPRSFRTRNLLSNNSRITLTEAIDYSQDTYAIHSERWIRALNMASSQAPTFAHAKALQILNQWNGRADTESIGITLYTEWQARCRTKGRDINSTQILSTQPLGATTARALLNAFSETVQHLERTYGRSTVYWKEMHRLRRDTHTWPLNGSAFGLRAIQSQQTRHTRDAQLGPSRTTLMCFRGPNKIESHTNVPFGQSDNPQSPHFIDQAQALYSHGKLKPTQFGISPKRLTLQHTLKMP